MDTAMHRGRSPPCAKSGQGPENNLCRTDCDVVGSRNENHLNHVSCPRCIVRNLSFRQKGLFSVYLSVVIVACRTCLKSVATYLGNLFSTFAANRNILTNPSFPTYSEREYR